MRLRSALHGQFHLKQVLWVVGVVWLAFLALAVYPSWTLYHQMEARYETVQQDLTELRRTTQGLASLEEQNAVRQKKVLRLEEDLVPPGGDVALLKQWETLTGGKVTVIAIRTEGATPLTVASTPAQKQGASTAQQTAKQGAATASSPYQRVTYRIEAMGDWANLAAYVDQLERSVPGVNLQSVQLDHAGAGGGWRLVATCQVYMVKDGLEPAS